MGCSIIADFFVKKVSVIRNLLGVVSLVVGVVWIGGCVTTPPDDLDNVCKIFKEKRGWYPASKRSYKKWGVPIHVQMAIIHQESRFQSTAKPPRRKFLGFIPTTRPSSAYGYGQVLDTTWKTYTRATGNRGADRNKFSDVVDFIGWYGNASAKRLRISKWDAKKQYLAYHEGHGGYERRTYRKKRWLLNAASKVETNAARYRRQLAGCEKSLHRGFRFWPF